MSWQKDGVCFCVMYLFGAIYEVLFSCVSLPQKKISSLGCTLAMKICYSPKYIF